MTHQLLRAFTIGSFIAVVACEGSTPKTEARSPRGVVTVEGTLFASAGIGGENTGTSIQTATEAIELVLDARTGALFIDGKKARATGTLTELSGVETSRRKALRVEDLFVCPTAPAKVNCPPGPNGSCDAGFVAFVKTNCPGVDVAF